MAGSVASNHFSSEWGGKVKIGSIGCNPFNHLVLRNVELIAPDNDTVCQAGTVALRFDKFPYDSHGLSFSRAKVKDTYYHLKIDTTGINLQFIISHYVKKEKKKTKSPTEFKVIVDDLILQNVHYKQDLKERLSTKKRTDIKGVDVVHMDYNHINGRFRNVRVDKDRVTCRIDKLSTVERSGLEVIDMHSNIYVSPSGISATNLHLETADSKLMGDVLLDYTNWKSMSHFLDSVVLTCHFLEGSYGNMRDAAFWTNALWGMDEKIFIDGWFSGPISDFHADSVHLAFGSETTLDLDASIYGLPHIDTTVINANIHKLHTTYNDLAAIRHPKGDVMKAAKLMKKLETFDLEATFAGTIYDFYATLDMNTSSGDVKGDVVLAMDPKKRDYRYVGELSSNGFLIGRIAPNEWISRSGFDLQFEGEGFDPRKMNASAEGQLHHTVVKGQRLTSEAAFSAEASDGVVSADISMDDELAALSAHGEIEWREDYPRYRANLDASHVDLKRFGLWNDTCDKEASLDARIDARYWASDETNNFARVAVDGFSLNTTTRKCKLKNAVLAIREQNRWKNVTLRSDILNAQVRGYFHYDALGQMATKMLNDYWIGAKHDDNNQNYDKIADARFELNAVWNDTAEILKAFLPQLTIATGTTLQANYNFVEALKPILRSDSIGWGNIRLYNVGLNGEAIAEQYNSRLTTDEIKIGKMVIAERSDITLECSQREASSRIYWENSSDAIGNGDLNLRLTATDETEGMKLIVGKTALELGGREWQIIEKGDVIFTPDGYKIDGLSMKSGESYLTVEADAMNSTESLLTINLEKFRLEVLNPVINGIIDGASINGAADGTIVFNSGNDNSGRMTADLKANNLVIDGEQLGDATIITTWNDELERIELTVNTERKHSEGKAQKPLRINGIIETRSSALDITAEIDDLALDIIAPMVNSFASDVKGNIKGNIKIGGTLQEPEITGIAMVDKGLIHIDMLNTAFGFSDTLFLDRNAIQLGEFIINDERGNKATASGSIKHKNLKDFDLDIGLKSDKLLCLNTTARHNETYYGTVIAAVDGIVKGKIENIDIVLNAHTLQGSTINVPINDKREAAQADYIRFISPEDDEDEIGGIGISGTLGKSVNDPDEASSSNANVFNLTINAEVNRDMTVRLPMDFSSVGADVKARGDGDLQIRVGTGMPFSLIGDYEMSDGTVSLDILSIISKVFAIDEGSSITFPGAVSDALFDIRAVFSQRVNMSSLTGSLSSTDSQKPVLVENIIALSGTIQSPDINFDIRLPNADQSTQEEVFAYIDRNNERDMLNQTVSLLVSKKFYNSSASNNSDQSTNTGDEAYGFVANTLGSMVSDMVQVVDVNFAYQAGNSLTTEQYAVDISKEWNKLYFETTFGFGGESREMSENSGNNNMTGDMLVGYKINPRLHLFVFNRSNTNDYTRSDLPYKQGVGLKYTRDFDKVRDLFVRRRNKK